MPELPEVETIKCGLESSLVGAIIENVEIRQPQLRWLVASSLVENLRSQKIHSLSRRGKYLLFHLDNGALIIHLGMSGSLRLLSAQILPDKHEHIDILFASHYTLRYRDPRRFGAMFWTLNPFTHKLLNKLGVEPLTEDFSGEYLFINTRKRNMPIKSLIMNSHLVVGVGNIYATESLFLAKIHPLTKANSLNQTQCNKLVAIIKEVLILAIQKGGTTLKDFVSSDGRPGYFVQSLQVYGRQGKPCYICHSTLENLIINQRNTVYCKHCQVFE